MSKYLLEYGGCPFVADEGRQVQRLSGAPQTAECLFDRLDRLLPFKDLHDSYNSREYAGRNVGQLARQIDSRPEPEPGVCIGEWHYPSGASKYSVFRGLATGAMVKKMIIAANGGRDPSTFVMQAEADGPDKGINYRLVSQMRILPPRPLAEFGGDFDGLFLVTLVDERFTFRSTPISIRPSGEWSDLIDELAETLDIELTYSDIEPEYAIPEPDSQLWCNQESAAYLLDCVAANLGRTLVRNLDSTYNLYTSTESSVIAIENRRLLKAKLAGGSLFSSGIGLRRGDLSVTKNSIVPQDITVAFPKYVNGDDPVPHYYNPRKNTVWYQDSYGETYDVIVPISSGGISVSGVTGVGNLSLHTTYKAMFFDESSAGGDPTNTSDVAHLAVKLAKDYYDSRALVAFDESYPGTINWNMEGIHDVVWTYSSRLKLASTRITRGEWTARPMYFQHGDPTTPPRQGGPLIAQVYKDDTPNTVYMVNLTTVKAPMTVSQGVDTDGGVSEAILRFGAASGQILPSGEINFQNTTINFQGSVGNNSSFNTINYTGTNFNNIYSSGNTLSGGNTSFNYYGTALGGPTFNYFGASLTQGGNTFIGGPTFNFFGGSTENYFSGAVSTYNGNSQLNINVGGGATLNINRYPSDGSTAINCPRFFTSYFHLKNPLVSVGQTLTKRQQLAQLTGLDTGSHLHFALGDAFTPFGQTDGTNSMVGNTIDVNSDGGWFDVIGTRMIGSEGPTVPTLTNAQITWIKQRIKKPIDLDFYWIQGLGSIYHFGKDYYACDIRTAPVTFPLKDEGKNVYQLVDNDDITTRVAHLELLSNGYCIVLQHDKNTDGCSIGALESGVIIGQPPCVFFDQTVGPFSFVSAVNFGPLIDLSAVFLALNPVTFNVPVKFYNGQWLHYREIDLTGQTTVNDLNLPLYNVAHRVVCRVSIDQDCQLRGMVPFPDGGSGQLIWLVNEGVTGKSLTIVHDSGTSTIGNLFLCPDGNNVILTPYSAAICWYDPAGVGGLDGYWRVIGFCCADEKLKISADDTTPGYGEDKIVAGTGVTITVLNPGANETLSIAASSTAARTETSLAATGTNQGTAALITNSQGAVEVTGADGTKGVILSDVSASDMVVWNNSVGPNSLKVYPPTGASFGATGANVAYVIGGQVASTFVRVTTTMWRVTNTDT